MFVWNAIPSITPVISAIFTDAFSISAIVVTTSAIATPPRDATCDAEFAVPSACRAALADWSTVASVKSGSDQVRQAGDTMSEIVTNVSNVTTIIAEVTHAADEQTRGIQEVNRAVSQLDEMVQQNAALVEQSTAAATALRAQANSLAASVGQFKLD